MSEGISNEVESLTPGKTEGAGTPIPEKSLDDQVAEAKARGARPDLANLPRRYTYHPPKGTQPERYAKLRSMALELATAFDEDCPPSRELSLAQTNLEQAVMWANAAIARNE